MIKVYLHVYEMIKMVSGNNIINNKIIEKLI